MLEKILEVLFSLIYKNLYLGVFLGTFLESIFPPIPSEIILPLAGYLISFYNLNVYDMLMGMLLASLGSTLASLIYYFLSFFLGRKFVEKYGKYFFIDKKKIRAADAWFKKYGKKAVFLGRMAPGIRELISIPAGFSRMKINDFLIYTYLGSLVWSTFLISIGYLLGENWKYLGLERLLNFIGLSVIIAIFAYLVFKWLVKKYSKK